jgi:hypothetical protein
VFYGKTAYVTAIKYYTFNYNNNSAFVVFSARESFKEATIEFEITTIIAKIVIAILCRFGFFLDDYWCNISNLYW